MKPYILGSLITLIIASPAAAHSCWIDSVTTYKTGVNVTFETYSPPFFTVLRASQTDISFRYRRYKGLYYQLTDNSGEINPDLVFGDPPQALGDDGVKLYLGDILLIENSPEDTCHLKIAEQNGKIGVQIEASFYSNMPDTSVQQESEFILGQ